MDDCVEILKNVLTEVKSEDVLKVREFLVQRGNVPSKCLSLKIIKQALATLKESKEVSEEVVTVEVSKGVWLTSNYPDYTLSETIYIGLYEENPSNAHEKMYLILEPILLSNTNNDLKKALFTPVNHENFSNIMRYLSKLLTMLTGEGRVTVCKALSKTFYLLLMSLPTVSKGGKTVIKASVPKQIFDFCPNIRRWYKV